MRTDRMSQPSASFIVFVIALGALGAWRANADFGSHKPIAKAEAGVFGLPGDVVVDENAPVWTPTYKMTEKSIDSDRKPASEARYVSKSEEI